MTDQLASVREAVRRASDFADDPTVREQLRSIDEGLMELTNSEGSGDGATTEGDEPHGDDLEEIEAKLAHLEDETDGAAQRRVKDARDAIDDYRQAYTRDW